MDASQKPDKKRADKKPAVNDMTDAIVPAAIRSWLIFLLIFMLLGYSVTFSILFGAVGGFAAGMVSAWWRVKGGEPPPPEVRQSARTGLPIGRLPGMRPGREKRYLRRRQR
ncbi:MAG: hypothetical protein F6J97_10870 [Leptolyngbya sp. SIO4C1]|nr:hypothetical protein [Leptolyngbya sp. SIO4C1]